MKKILFIALMLVMGFTLLGCEPEPTEIVHVDITAVQSQITETIENVEKAVVAVANFKGSVQQGTGSGVIYKQVGTTYYVITNEHVVRDSDSLRVFIGLGRYIDATLVGFDAYNDVAVVTFDYSIAPLQVVELAYDHVVRRGEFVLAMGSPLGVQYYNTATLGIVSGRQGNLIQHDAAINPGNSGGPLFNIMGKLIGINVSKIMETPYQGGVVPVAGIGFAINVPTLVTSVTQIEEHGSIERPRIGITVTQIHNFLQDEEVDATLIPEDMTDGLIVIEVAEDTPASRAGIVAHDIVIKINNTFIYTTDDVRIVMSSKRSGDVLTMVLLRKIDGTFTEITLQVTL